MNVPRRTYQVLITALAAGSEENLGGLESNTGQNCSSAGQLCTLATK